VQSGGSSQAFNSYLKIHAAGGIYNSDGLYNRGSYGYYWSSSDNDASNGKYNDISINYGFYSNYRSKSYGFSIRCLRATNTSGNFTITTQPVSAIRATTAMSGGNITDDGGSTVTARGVCYSTSSGPTIANSIVACGPGGGMFTANLSGLTPGSTYFIRSFATNGNSTYYGDELSFTTLSGIVSLTTTAATSITAISASSGGNITTDGGSPVSSRGICFSTSTNPTIADTIVASGSGTGSFSANLASLTNNTTYHVRSYGTNSVATYYGDEVVFTTLSGIVSLSTAAITSVTATSAVSGGTITSDGGSPITARGICYSTSLNPTIANTIVASGSGTGSFTANLTGLTNNTTYHVRSYGTNSVATYYGEDVVFTTLSGIVTLSTASITSVTATSAASGGTITSNGGSPITARGICYSTSLNPTIANTIVTSGSGTGTFTANLTGLTNNTTYHVRSYGTNGVATYYGDELVFTTLSGIALLSTAPITLVTSISAACGGTITSDGGSPITARGICYSTSANPTTANIVLASGSGTGSFTANLTGLTPSTTYFIKAYAINNIGTYYGDELSFTTFPEGYGVVTLSTTPIISITSSSAVSGGSITGDGGVSISNRGVCWSTSQNPTIANYTVSNGTGTGSYSSSLTGLSFATTYYVRAFATNSVNTYYGEELSFTTQNFICGNSILTVNHIATGGVAPVDKATTYGTVTNIPGEPTKCWITKNLGATNQASTVNDATEAAAGWYWQFNRKQGYKHDGTTRTPATTWISNINENSGWIAANDPCTIELGNSWRLPSNTEWNNVNTSGGWTSYLGPWNSGLKIHASGAVTAASGSRIDIGVTGYFWSSTQNYSVYAYYFYCRNNASTTYSDLKANAVTIRCIKN